MQKDRLVVVVKELMLEHGLTQTGWSFSLSSNMTSCYGLCERGRKSIRLSKRFVQINNEEEVRLVLLHEIAHALTKGGHDREFYAKCREIGARDERCNKSEGVVKEWSYECPNGCMKGQTRKYRKRSIYTCRSCNSELHFFKTNKEAVI